MGWTLVTAVGTILYQGALFSGPKAEQSCRQALSDVVSRIESLETRVLTGTCAPISIIGSDELGYGVQVQMAAPSGIASIRIDRQVYRSVSPCTQNIARLPRQATREIPIIGLHCRDGEMVIDSIAQRDVRLQWGIATNHYPTVTACQSAYRDLEQSLVAREIRPFFYDCEPVLLGDTRVVGARLSIAATMRSRTVLGFFSEEPFARSEHCEASATKTRARLDELGLGAGWSGCVNQGSYGFVGRHLIYDRVLNGPTRLAEAPVYPSEVECLAGARAIEQFLESERNQVITNRCVPQGRAGYRVAIDYLRAPWRGPTLAEQ